MNQVRTPKANAPASVHIAEDIHALNAFKDPGCAAALWARKIPTEVQDWLDGLAPEDLPRDRIVLHRSAVAAALREMGDAAGLSQTPERTWFEQDIVALADMFVDLMNVEYLRLRLDVVTTNACRKFHIDAIKARVVCTYRGTGTQFGVSDGKNDPEQIFTVQSGAPILLRGTKWPAVPPSGLLHRSPPIEGSGETRLLLVLDPVYDPQNEA